MNLDSARLISELYADYMYDVIYCQLWHVYLCHSLACSVGNRSAACTFFHSEYDARL